MAIKNITQYIPKDAAPEFFDSAAVFEVSATNIQEIVADLYNDKKLSLKMITATDERREHGCFKVWYIFSVPEDGGYVIPVIKVTTPEEFPSVAIIIHQAWNYERKIKTFFGLTPIGHPDAQPLILHENWPKNVYPLRKDFDWQDRPKEAKGTYQFQKVAGEGIYEIPVGPIHAGIIEPGHFRFSVAGEEIILLEPRLGFTHKGSEKLFEILTLNDQIRLSEKISGDSSFSHSLAFCQAIEKLSDSTVPKRARYLRVIYAELERLANHFGDIGAIMTDTGFNFGGAQGARLREMLLQINERLTGSRFLRGVNTVGGVTKDILTEEKNKLINELDAIVKDFSEVVSIAENSTSLLNRLKGTGVLTLEAAEAHGVVGVAARAVGLAVDTRADFPYAAYDELSFKIAATESSGDVFARFQVRIKEVKISIEIIKQALHKLPAGDINLADTPVTLKKHALAVSAVEGWRGEIIYFVMTDAAGNVTRVAPRDPSFVNWPALGGAGVGNVVPDFPLINKSFNLSYSGNDL